ncbi:MAG: BamA/TamA family outer membrane protein [Acidobacteria bacterium]|nr:BamA/TamA family outer membrane protein [Acidobacteriota bacterium]
MRVEAPEGILQVRVRESRFLVRLATRDPDDLSAIGVSRRGAGPEEAPPDGAVPDWILLQNLLVTPGDYDNLERFRQERFRLARLGHDIAFVAGEDDAGTGFRSAAYLILPRGGGGGAPGTEADRPPPDRNYVGGNVTYGPRRGLRVQGVYRRWRWLTPFDTLEVSPEADGNLGGNLRYRTEYLLPETVARRNVSLSLNLFSDSINDRIVNGVQTDERREGGRAFLGIGLLPGNPRHDLELGAGIERSRVTFRGDPFTDPAENFTLARILGAYTFRHLYRPPRFQVRARPEVLLALAELGGEYSYQAGMLDADLHGWSFRRLEVDLHLAGGLMNDRVPPSEELRLGGGRTVRGFEEDDFSGKRMIALQSELWFPISPAGAGGNRFLRRIRGALFVDAGAIGGGSQGLSGEAVGAGTGVRFQIPGNPLFLKLDYGTGIHGGGDGHAYLSLAFLY